MGVRVTEPARLRVVEPDACPECERLHGALAAAQVDVENANLEIKRLRRALNARQIDESGRRKRHPNHEVAERLFEFWKEECGHPRAQLGFKREKALLARLEQYEPREIAMAIRGAAKAAYVDEKGVRHDDIELICRDEVKLEKFIERYVRWKGERSI